MLINWIAFAYISYLNNMWDPIEKKPGPGDHKFNLKLCQSIGLIVKNRSVTYL